MLLSQGFEPKNLQLESLGWVLAILTVFFISLTYHLAIEIVATQDWLPLRTLADASNQLGFPLVDPDCVHPALIDGFSSRLTSLCCEAPLFLNLNCQIKNNKFY